MGVDGRQPHELAYFAFVVSYKYEAERRSTLVKRPRPELHAYCYHIFTHGESFVISRAVQLQSGKREHFVVHVCIPEGIAGLAFDISLGHLSVIVILVKVCPIVESYAILSVSGGM